MLDYGLIGNAHMSALVSKKGSVDWLCYPDMAGKSVFGRLLGKDAGHLDIKPSSPCRISQSYLTGTNILETLFESKSWAFRVIDFFPRFKIHPQRKGGIVKGNHLIRIVEPLRGAPSFRIAFHPRMDYARAKSDIRTSRHSLEVVDGKDSLTLVTNAEIDDILSGKLITLSQRLFLAFGSIDDPSLFSIRHVMDLRKKTERYWKKWVSSLILPERNKDAIIRSALILKLLSFDESGAIMAAATTSIPEEIGSERCFDYRFCWVRDAAYTVDALNKIGRFYEAKSLIDFLLDRVSKDDHLQILYGIHGETRLKEEELPHLEGFHGSRPVRIGNAAFNQDQHDIYGEIVDILYLYFVYYKIEKKLSKKYWRFLRWLVNQIKFSWDKPDSGIWEFRGKSQHFVYSKMMCHLGVDRAIKIAQHFGLDRQAVEWAELKGEIMADILKNGYNQEKGAFTMFYGSRDLDASLLHMTYHEFLPPSDPRLISTIRAIYRELRQGHLVRRYKVKDDFGVSKSSFTICSFWLVDALIYIGETKKANEIYQKLLKHSNHLGIFSEDIDLRTGSLIGNFPQGYTHIAMINTSILLSEWSAKRKSIDWSRVRRKQWF